MNQIQQSELSRKLGMEAPELLEHSLTVIVNSKAYPVTRIGSFFPFMSDTIKPREPIPVSEYARWSLEGMRHLTDAELGKLVRATLNHVENTIKQLEKQPELSGEELNIKL